ncbi:MAG: DUF58 domain-containing protein [Planctomycetales bacterium]|nr:DUF58 domain-containing protein [Planctomycetales bacterium]
MIAAAAAPAPGRLRALGRSYAALTAGLILSGLVLGEVLLLATGIVTGLLGAAAWAYVAGSRVESLRWLYARRGARVSREGWLFVALALGLCGAAMNTGANLLYLVFAMMCAGLIVSGILCLNAIRGIRLTGPSPAPVPAGGAAALRVRIENRKWLFPSHSLRVDAQVPDGLSLAEAAFVPQVPARGHAEGLVRILCRRRGLYPLGDLRVSTDFPFGLVRKSVWCRGGLTLAVLPRVGTLTRAALGGRPAPNARADGGDGRRPGDGEFHGLRDYRDGDNPRRIHWRSTARARRLMVRDFREERISPALLCVAGLGDGPALDPSADMAATVLHAWRLGGRAPILALSADPPACVRASDGAGEHAARLALAGWTGGLPERALDAVPGPEIAAATVLVIAPDRDAAEAAGAEARRRGAANVEVWTPAEVTANGWVAFEDGSWQFQEAAGRADGRS